MKIAGATGATMAGLGASQGALAGSVKLEEGAQGYPVCLLAVRHA